MWQAEKARRRGWRPEWRLGISALLRRQRGGGVHGQGRSHALLLVLEALLLLLLLRRREAEVLLLHASHGTASYTRRHEASCGSRQTLEVVASAPAAQSGYIQQPSYALARGATARRAAHRRPHAGVHLRRRTAWRATGAATWHLHGWTHAWGARLEAWGPHHAHRTRRPGRHEAWLPRHTDLWPWRIERRHRPQGAWLLRRLLPRLAGEHASAQGPRGSRTHGHACGGVLLDPLRHRHLRALPDHGVCCRDDHSFAAGRGLRGIHVDLCTSVHRQLFDCGTRWPDEFPHQMARAQDALVHAAAGCPHARHPGGPRRECCVRGELLACGCHGAGRVLHAAHFVHHVAKVLVHLRLRLGLLLPIDVVPLVCLGSLLTI
mmetsp:Transcript_133875/g.346716  ORF Transcript_133875/g.346716 Transcript_133875/m.346716 type:complete len:377 (+) Transcript_133875:155-1285(+)